MNSLGVQLLLDLRACNVELLDDLPFIRSTLLEAAESMGATVVGQTFHKFAPHGVTGVVAIAESHLCIHTWPEYGYAAVDIFSCSERFDYRGTARALIAKLEAQEHSMTELKRGVLNQPAGVTG